MYKTQIPKINDVIKQTGKVIIGLGCSFVQGDGAVNDELYTNYKAFPKFGEVTQWDLTDQEKKEILSKYPNVSSDRVGELVFLQMEHDNAFVNVLCDEYFDGEYAAINFGIRGSGNRATIKELYFYPDILWDEIKEIIVVYCPSGLERFDFINDQYADPNEHGRWKTMWPNDSLPTPGGRSVLWTGYKNSVWSSKFEVLEQIVHVQELLLWCRHKNAKLIITPAFHQGYTRDNFEGSLMMNIAREDNDEFVKVVDSTWLSSTTKEKKDVEALVNMWPWDKMFAPGECPTFADLAISQDFPDSWKDTFFFNYINTGTPNGWLTPCAHPGAKAHNLFASYLHKHITQNYEQL